MTVRAWWEVWTTNPLYKRPKPATNINNQERTRAFVAQYGDIPLRDITRRTAIEWLRAGNHGSTVKFLRTMFSDAVYGELIDRNPFVGLGLERGKGNALKQPPSVAQAQDLISTAWEICTPGFAAWLQVACFTGMRSCELDALRWDRVDLDAGWIVVDREFCSKSMSFQAPKNGKTRHVLIHDPARRALVGLAHESEFVFVNSRGDHWSRPARAYQWRRVCEAADWHETMYLSTRHFAGWWLYQVLMLPAEDVAAALGHEDRGELVRKLYGHFNHDAALERVRVAAQAYFDGEDELARRRRTA